MPGGTTHVSNAFVQRLSPHASADLNQPLLQDTNTVVDLPAPRQHDNAPAPAPPSGKSRLRSRWLVLVLSSLMQLGNYYCYDNPAALLVEMREQFSEGPQKAQFDFYYEMLYSVYSLPNIFLPLLGGLLVDRVGMLFSIVLFSSLLLGGQVLFALGDTISSLNVMLLGRALFGLGGESMAVAQSSVVAQWFQGKELAMALGVNLSFSRLGSVVNNAISPAIARMASVSVALWFGALVCLCSWASALALSLVDRHHTRAIRRAERRWRHEQMRQQLQHDTSAKLPPVKEATERISLSDTRSFSSAFWILALCTVVIYSSVLPFNNIAEALLQDRDYFKYGTRWRDAHNRTFVYSPETPNPPGTDCHSFAGQRLPFCKARAAAKEHVSIVMSEPYVMSACVSPVLGHLVDQRGGRAGLIVVSAMTLSIVHVLLGFSSIPAFLLLFGVGFSYCVFAAARRTVAPSPSPHSYTH
mmetsp:Transcript_26369/g.57769  ORF Transcript_26369/g.57769 Transcript_26369/m.57769 type:complete len:470 (-) Transcript_26369:160-1569(-)